MTSSLLLPQSILINQAGYKPSFPKYVFVNKPAVKFFINDAKTGKVVFNGKLKLWKESDPATGMTIYKGDFSSFKGIGTFYITTGNTDSSYRFDISETVYNDVYSKTLKSYYLQRCGTALLQAYAGPYVHPECHMTDGVYHPTTGLSGSHSLT
jgi:endoglucanase